MSKSLLLLATAFLENKIEPKVFAEEYMAEWRRQRDSEGVRLAVPQINEALSTIFCMADMFNPNPDREEYEFDETRLRKEVGQVMDQLKI